MRCTWEVGVVGGDVITLLRSALFLNLPLSWLSSFRDVWLLKVSIYQFSALLYYLDTQSELLHVAINNNALSVKHWGSECIFSQYVENPDKRTLDVFRVSQLIFVVPVSQEIRPAIISPSRDEVPGNFTLPEDRFPRTTLEIINFCTM